jgi:TRAP-type C4-dicarboxylate transport system permease small subunit
MKKTLVKIDKILAGIENSIIVVLVTVIVLMSFWQVVLRNFFDSGILWGDIFLRHLVLWIGFVGASLATRDNKHISIDALTRLAALKTLPILKFLTNAVSMMVSFILANAGWKFLMYEKEAGTVLFQSDWFGEVHAWTLQMIIPLGFGLIAFRFFLKILEQFLGDTNDISDSHHSLTNHSEAK